MKKTFKVYLIYLSLIILSIVGIFYVYNYSKEKDLVSNYLDTYYSQVKISKEELSEIENSIVSASNSVNINGEIKENFNISKIKFYNKFTKYVSNSYLNFMISSGNVPDYNLINYGEKNNIVKYSVENIKYEKYFGNVHNVTYDLILKDNSGNKKILSKDNTVVIKRENKELKIMNIAKDLEK